MSLHYIYGLHAVKKKLQLAADDIEALYGVKSNNQRLQQVISLAKQKGVRIELTDRDQLAKLCQSDKHQGCVAGVRGQSQQAASIKELLQQLSPRDLFLVLDGIQDPHNLGACLRTADGAGVKAVIIPRDRASGITPVVSKVAAGAAESITLVTVTNLARTLAEMRAAGVWVVGTTGEADQTLYQQTLSGPLALVMGSEGEGMRRLTMEQCDYLVKLPMQGAVESLNVSVATGICLYEINRQLTA